MDDLSRTNEFLRLLMKNRGRIFAFIMSMVPRHADAEDLLQQTTLVMWSKFDNYQAESSFASWAITIAKFQILKVRRRYATQCLQWSKATEERLQKAADGFIQQVDPRTQVLRDCVEKLDPPDYNLIQMRYEQDITVKTIAERLGRSVQSIYKKMARIHDKLLRCVRRHIAEEGLA